jgi:hypothetical protein
MKLDREYLAAVVSPLEISRYKQLMTLFFFDSAVGLSSTYSLTSSVSSSVWNGSSSIMWKAKVTALFHHEIIGETAFFLSI